MSGIAGVIDFFISHMYWKIQRPTPRHYADEEECLHDFRTIFREAIRCRLRGASSVATQSCA